MARIFLSMSGEGRGHAARVAALVEHLHARHQLKVFSPGAAYDLLEPLGRRHGFEVERIPGITNRYTRERRFDLLATGLAVNDYVLSLPRLIQRLEAQVRVDRPDLVITDFEPALPRAAMRCGVPYMSVDHQHVLVVSDLTSLPAMLQWHAFWMGVVIRRFYSEQCAQVVSSFYQPPLKAQYADAVQVGVLLRSAVQHATVEAEDHLVAYFRRFAPARVLDSLSRTGRPVRVYGLGRRGRWGNLEFLDIDGDRFLTDLASCRALVATAGNQLVGEALYLGKPVLVMPEAHNFEQAINAHFLRELGGGASVELEACGSDDVGRFLMRADSGEFEKSLSGIDGTLQTLAIIDDVIAMGASRRACDEGKRDGREAA